MADGQAVMIWLAALTLLFLLLAGLALVPGRLGRLRLAAVAVGPLAVFLVWPAVHAYEGWPVPVAVPPAGAVFVAAQVDPGRAVYLWLATPASPRPRAYRVPYSDQAYAMVLRAEQASRRGEQVRVQQPARRLGGRPGMGQRLPAFALRVYRLPPVAPPPKNAR